MAFLIENYSNIGDDYLNIKFEPSLKRSTITNERITVRALGATPVDLVDPFKPINIDHDYNTISKLLRLYWKPSVLEPDQEYQVTVSGLQNAIGSALPNGTFTFTTDDTVTSDDPEHVAEYEKVPEIIDYSIQTGIVTDAKIWDGVNGTSTGEAVSGPGLKVESVDPKNGSYYLAEDTSNGVITINFSGPVLEEYATPNFFKVQRKRIQRQLTRWEPLVPDVERDAEDPSIVRVKLPSDDAVPVYDVNDKVYFKKEYKYRVIVSKGVGS